MLLPGEGFAQRSWALPQLRDAEEMPRRPNPENTKAAAATEMSVDSASVTSRLIAVLPESRGSSEAYRYMLWAKEQPACECCIRDILVVSVDDFEVQFGVRAAERALDQFRLYGKPVYFRRYWAILPE